MSGRPVEGSLFIYAPNKVAPVIFTVLFAISSVGHIWQCYRYKAFKLVGLQPVCAVTFTLGYALREYGAFNYLYTSTLNLIIFILSQVFIYACPPLLELANYHVLGRIFYYVPHLAPLPPGRVLAIFGGLMAVIEALNGVGVSLSANPSSSKSTQDLGGHLSVAAISMQLGAICIFMVLAAIFHRRCMKANIRTKRVLTPLLTLYASMALILIRCIYRLVEHMGYKAIDLEDFQSLFELTPILRYEWFFYVFEATLMFINSAIWNIWNPARYLPQNYHVYLSKDGVTELEGMSDSRSWPQKLVSTLTFGILYRRKIEGPPFEELTSYSQPDRPAPS